jgi:hypothetical protein
MLVGSSYPELIQAAAAGFRMLRLGEIREISVAKSRHNSLQENQRPHRKTAAFFLD